MRIRSLRLVDFRAHAATRVSFTPGLNLLHGANGTGKTNVLEAVHYCCLGKSFVTSNDQYALRRGARFFEVEADFSFDSRSDATVRLTYVPGEGKRLAVNGAPLDRLSDAVGRFPVVSIAPDDHRLTDGGPEERRRFLDTILCQESPTYLDHLVRYRRALRQRNELLARQAGRATDAMLDAWDAELVRHGARITLRRMEFFDRFDTFLGESWRLVDGRTERPTLRYRPFAPGLPTDEAEVAAAFADLLRDRAQGDRERGLTHTGPHRDEIVFRLDDLEVRRYASHGQHRTFVLALRLAQFFYLADRLGETPLFLLDDVFDTLDPDRINLFAGLLTQPGRQSLVTAAHDGLFRDAVDWAAGGHSALLISETLNADAP